MKDQRLSLAVLMFAFSLFGCAVMHDVQASGLKPQYAHATPPLRSAEPLVLVYDPNELPDVVPISVPPHFPDANVLGARSLVTEHLRKGLESMFEHVSVTTDANSVPTGSIVGTVHFVSVGLALSEGGNTLVGTLEWSLALRRQGEQRTFYSWGERIVGTREGAGSFGYLNPTTQVLGALEASLRALLKDMTERGITSDAPAPAPVPAEPTQPAPAAAAPAAPVPVAAVPAQPAPAAPAPAPADVEPGEDMKKVAARRAELVRCFPEAITERLEIILGIDSSGGVSSVEQSRPLPPRVEKCLQSAFSKIRFDAGRGRSLRVVLAH